MAETILEKDTILYSVARGIFTVFFHTLMPVKTHDAEKVNDREAPFILIANHQHALDPICMAMAIKGRQICFLGKKQLGSTRIGKWAMAHLHCILVDRHNMDMEAIRSCMKTIRLKRILLIFPEGTRHHEGQMEQIESGASLIALRGHVPVIPMYFDRKLRFFRKTNLYTGDPIPMEDLLAEGINAETCEKLNGRMRETYRDMIRRYGHFDD